MQNVQSGNLENAIGRLMEESLISLNEMDRRIQTIRAGIMQAVPSLAASGHAIGDPTGTLAGSQSGFTPGTATTRGFGNPSSPSGFGIPFPGASLTTAFVLTPFGLVPVTVPTTAILASGVTGNPANVLDPSFGNSVAGTGGLQSPLGVNPGANSPFANAGMRTPFAHPGMINPAAFGGSFRNPYGSFW